MKVFLLIIFCTFSINSYSQKMKYVTWDDILIERSIESLYNTLNQSKEYDERELLENNLLIRDNGYLIDNKYFDTLTTTKIQEKKLGRNLFCNKKEFSRIFRYLKTNKISFLKVTIKKFHFNTKNNYYVFFETMVATKSKKYGINYKYYNTLAFFKYKWNDSVNNGDYELEEFELFNP